MGQDSGTGLAGRGSLDTKGDSSTPPDALRRARRVERDELKAVQRKVSVLHSAALCMFGQAGTVTVDVGAQRIAHVSGVHRCGSPWSCPLCAPVIRQRRAEEIDQALAAALDRGYSALFVTSTVAHSRRDLLAPRLDAIAEIGGRVRAGAPWVRRRDRLGFLGAVASTEVTWGARNGWHPHSHAAWVFERTLSDADVEDFGEWCFGRICGLAGRKGLGALDRRAFDVQRINSAGALADYLTKIDGGWSAGLELARSDVKAGRGGEHLTPFELLRWLMTTGEARPLTLWHEYERATKGKKAIRFSPGLRGQLIGSEVEASDEELAASEGVDLSLLRLLVDSGDWNRIVATGRRAAFLGEVEDVASALMLLADLLGYSIPPIDLEVLSHA